MAARYAFALQLRGAQHLRRAEDTAPLPIFAEEYSNAAVLCAIELKRILPHDQVALAVMDVDDLRRDGAEPDLVSSAAGAVASITYISRLGESLGEEAV